MNILWPSHHPPHEPLTLATHQTTDFKHSIHVDFCISPPLPPFLPPCLQNVIGTTMPGLTTTTPLSTESSFLGLFPSSSFYVGLEPLEPTESLEGLVSGASNFSRLGGPRCTYKEDFKRILLPAVYSLVFLVGLPLNAAVIQKIWRLRPNLSRNNIYMLNLAASDLTLIAFLPFRIIDAIHCLPKENHLCTVLISVHYINMYASILTSTAISVHRYLLVRFPVRAKAWRWQRLKAVAVCLTWDLITSTLELPAVNREHRRVVSSPRSRI